MMEGMLSQLRSLPAVLLSSSAGHYLTHWQLSFFLKIKYVNGKKTAFLTY